MNQRILKVLFFMLSVACCAAAASGGPWNRPWSAPGRPQSSSPSANAYSYAFNSPHPAPRIYHQKHPAPFTRYAPAQNFIYPNLQPQVVRPANQEITVQHHPPRNNLNPHLPYQLYAPNHMQPQAYNQKYVIPNGQIKYPSTPVRYPSVPVKYPNVLGQQAPVADRYRGNAVAINSSPNPYRYAAPNNNPPAVHRPYAAVKPFLNQYSEDPILHKIMKDVDANEYRLKKNEEVPQKYDPENDESDEPSYEVKNGNIHQNQEQENFVPRYENYYPQTKPSYYKKPVSPPINHDNLNKYAVYPRPNFENIKVHPSKFQPLKQRLDYLKKDQGKTFNPDNRNEYPANNPADDDEDEDELEGRDIFDRQRNAFDNQNSNFNRDFNQFTKANHPNANHLPPFDYHDDEGEKSDEEKFIPVKMYAQVRHTESTKHLPRQSAYDDAVTYDDYINAPRLREAIKTSKAQIVYSEEGYEDGAYDHAGHTKHASNHEGHGGYLNDKYNAAGLRNKNSANSYEDAGKSIGGSEGSYGKKWSDDEGIDEEFDDEETQSSNDGRFTKSDNDLTEAGSEKKDTRNTRFKPIKYFKENKKVVTSDIFEKKYEEVAAKSDVDNYKKKESSKKLEEVPDEFAGTHLRKALEFNYGSDDWQTGGGSKPKSKDQYSAQSDVEVFSEDLKTNDGPKHGGNYKHIQSIEKKENKWPIDYAYATQNDWRRRVANNFDHDIFHTPREPLGKTAVKEREPKKRSVNKYDVIDLFGDTSDQPKRYSKKYIHTPEEFGSDFEEVHGGSKHEPGPSKTTGNRKNDEFPITSDVEVFTPEFSRGPKHGGNYKKYSSSKGKQKKKKKSEEASELDDLNSANGSSQGFLHGGNYRTARDHGS